MLCSTFGILYSAHFRSVTGVFTEERRPVIKNQNVIVTEGQNVSMERYGSAQIIFYKPTSVEIYVNMIQVKRTMHNEL